MRRQKLSGLINIAAGNGATVFEKEVRMIELHIYLEPHDGKEGELESLYWKEYVSGIKNQQGFQRTTLLKRRDALREYQVDITFDSEALRLKWVDSKEHTEIWPKMAALCQRVSWSGFDTVEAS
jgi:heme-degrading monooxygenase HmoA